jgi:hypothetical protein
MSQVTTDFDLRVTYEFGADGQTSGPEPLTVSPPDPGIGQLTGTVEPLRERALPAWVKGRLIEPGGDWPCAQERNSSSTRRDAFDGRGGQRLRSRPAADRCQIDTHQHVLQRGHAVPGSRPIRVRQGPRDRPLASIAY